MTIAINTAKIMLFLIFVSNRIFESLHAPMKLYSLSCVNSSLWRRTIEIASLLRHLSRACALVTDSPDGCIRNLHNCFSGKGIREKVPRLFHRPFSAKNSLSASPTTAPNDHFPPVCPDSFFFNPSTASITSSSRYTVVLMSFSFIY